MAHKIYDNFFLANEIEDQYKSHLNLQQFCTIDNDLVLTPGMTKIINRYRATDGTEKLKMGQGNTKSIEVGFNSVEYRIELAQNRFDWYDEQEMTDPMLLPTGTKHMATDMFNTVNADVYGQYFECSRRIMIEKPDFAAFVDAVAALGSENIEGLNLFAFVSPSDIGAIRKALGEQLKYVEAFAKNGYVGSVAGVNIYQKKDAIPGDIVVANKNAVTIFNKKGTEVEYPTRDSDSANVRKNSVFSRKYYVVALTDDRFAVVMHKGTAKATTDTTVDENKKYYKQEPGGHYARVTPETNPKSEGLFEIA